MYNIEYLDEAEDDLESMYAFISKDSIENAITVLLHIKSTIEILRDFPNIWVPDVWGTRKIVDSKYRYRIYYIFENGVIYLKTV